MNKNLKNRIEALERAGDKESGPLVLSGPDGQAEATLQEWMQRTGAKKPSLYIYLKRFSSRTSARGDVEGVGIE